MNTATRTKKASAGRGRSKLISLSVAEVLDRDGNFGVGTNCDFPFVYGNDEEGVNLYIAEYRDGKTTIKRISEDETELD